MEDSTPFDLNEAIRRWRQGLASSPAFRAENLDELETHLRDSALALESGGLTAAEAVLIASRRLGDRAGLEREFGKTNVRELWLDRSLWMVLGLLLFSFVQRLSFGPEAAIRNLVLSGGLSAHWAGALFLFGRWIVPLAGTAAAVWLCTRHGQRLARLAHWCLRRWWLTGLVLVLLLYDVHVVANGLRDFLLILLGPTVANPPGMEEQAILDGWMWWTMTIQQPLWLVLVTVLGSYAQRLRCAQSETAFRVDAASIVPDQVDLVQQLQSQGLSLEEACFLATRRGGPGLAVEAERPNAHRVMGPVVSGWFAWSHVAFQMAIPVALLLWLARSRMRARRA